MRMVCIGVNGLSIDFFGGRQRFEYSLDRIFPWIAGVVVWIIYILLALAKSRELSQDADLASAIQSLWLIGEGYAPESTLLGQNYLAGQGGFLIYQLLC